MTKIDEKNIENKLRQVIETVDVANALTEPLTATIDSLLKTSAAKMNSEEASVLIRHGSEGDLLFLCAIGKVADKIVGLRLPAGKGIAGFVFSSGQPIAVSDVGEEESFYAEVDKKTGYSTETVLATPLIYSGNVIGVLEYVNRVGFAPYEPFTPEEMELAAIYADTIAGIVNAYESASLFKDLSKRILSEEDSSSFSDIQNWLKKLRNTTHHKDMIELAILVYEISHRGEAERNLCKEILNSIVNFTDNNLDSKFSRL